MKKKILAVAALAACSLSAQAVTITQTKTGTNTVFDTSSNNASVTAYGTSVLTFDKFDTNSGVLLNVSSTYDATSTLTGSGVRSHSGTASFNASSGSAFTATGSAGSYTGYVKNNSVSTSASGTTALSLPKSDDSTWSGNVTAGGGLSNYAAAGGGSLTTNVAYSNAVNLGSTNRVSNAKATSVFDISQTLTYEYKLHSNSSFLGTEELDRLMLNVTGGENKFSVFNYGGGDRIGLAIGEITCSGDCDVFSIGNLALGENTASFLGTTAGDYQAMYRLNFYDAAGYGARYNHLDLTLTGAIAAVPEPSTYGMLAVGLGMLAFTARRKKNEKFDNK